MKSFDIELRDDTYEKLVAMAAREGITPEQLVSKIIQQSANKQH